MKIEWDYAEAAKAYLKRPNHSGIAIDAMLKFVDMTKGSKIFDVGTGVAHLSLELALRSFNVKAIEPNYAMRTLGKERTKHLTNTDWDEGIGEATMQKSDSFEMVTFGSSFNVCDPKLTPEETARIFKPNGWFACLYNNRYLSDPIQLNIENIIKEALPDDKYGFKRENHSKIIEKSKLFCPVVQISSSIIHKQKIEAFVEALKFHATLAWQAGSKFDQIIGHIKKYLISLESEDIQAPYQTNVWLAKLK